MGDFHTQPDIGDTLNALLLIEHGCEEGLATRTAKLFGEKCQEIATLRAKANASQALYERAVKKHIECDAKLGPEIATLQARVDELTKALKATREQLIKVRDASPKIRNHELETNQVIAQAWHTLNDTGVAIPLEMSGGAT